MFITSEGSTDFNATIVYFRNCRELTRNKDKEEKSLFLLTEYKNCIVNDMNASRFTSVWKLPEDKIVCRNSWALAYDFKMHELENCSDKLKANKDTV